MHSHAEHGNENESQPQHPHPTFGHLLMQKLNLNTLIRSATTFSQREKEFCRLLKERRGFDKRFLI
jgi:hypothetical protein